MAVPATTDWRRIATIFGVLAFFGWILSGFMARSDDTQRIAKRLEEVFLPDAHEAQSIAKSSPGLKLLQQVRNEAHRFAITYHRALRSIEGDTSRSIQDVDRLIGDLNAEISRENGYLARERANLAALSYGINVGRLGNPGIQRGFGGPNPQPRRVVQVPVSPSASPVLLGAAPR